MIVNLVDTGWEVIYHRAHALLAAQIAGYWNLQADISYIVEIISAISHHDDLEKEWEGDHLSEAGAPLDFTLDGKLCVEDLRQHINSARYRSRWVALLTAMHVSFLNEGRRKDSKDLDRFLDELEQQQQAWLQEMSLEPAEAKQAYALMRWCDRLSLILCRRNLPEAQRSLEITPGPDQQGYTVMQRADKTVTVEPWPFKPPEFTVHVDATYLKQIAFKDSQELVEQLQSAPVKALVWQLAK
ncbi:MAG: DUF3891 family protein [Leptolyngbyaceae cyanobacterium SM1_1_3]|nr:DUF3891 family protein [Leptolyngbyaceae cyanobacterium SM1_1_3]NJN03327.1 DUF3891 family protein [Leptolyngbyaceae cyanobacterium RM1_1_2]NJO11295.1 DUF3891 family protein [Leptolyngbyaceae cyanobacterium SL_1_1]